jgi:N-acetylglutamate synthase-like GNAT family acetyltransferase
MLERVEKLILQDRIHMICNIRKEPCGKTLMQFIENRIKDIGGKIAEIHVVDKNITLREWYKKINYVEIRIDEIKTLPFNSCVMNKDLTN